MKTRWKEAAEGTDSVAAATATQIAAATSAAATQDSAN